MTKDDPRLWMDNRMGIDLYAKIFAVLHLIAIPVIIYWSYTEARDADYDSILGRVHDPPGGMTFLMQLYLALSGALFWAAVAAALGLLRTRGERENG